LPIALPAALPAAKLTPADAGAIAARARKLLRRGLITHCQHVLIDTLLWSCRTAGTTAASASYGTLQRLAHMARATIAVGLTALERLGLLQRVKRRVLVVWHNGGRAWRQLPNEYRFTRPADCEFSARTDSKTPDITILARPAADAAKASEALAAVRERRRSAVEARLLGKRSGR
jgi:hypothetical protein